MLIDKISEIDPDDDAMIDLELLAAKFGIFNMTVVIMKTNKFQNQKDQRIQMTFTVETYRQVVAELISLAVLNFASVKHDYFSVAINTELAQNFYRVYTIDEHHTFANNFLKQALQILDKYED